MWTNDQLYLLIAERRNRNTKYHDIPRSSKRILTRKDKTTNRDNINNVNNANGNSGYNTNDVGRNLDNAIYSSLSNLVNTTSTPNIFASQNNSDISMLDIEGSQLPSYIENINEED
ncbi:8321_t:CDS:2 [Scutellospora calospora]|uniref:8321_t:CDS:1 n=1 Tax=Scutellospora calospora TaxID=85575 RepID=A0ACA9K6I1_9GLOM|nr:8321_t:CDS:2 [Scutellospora calospora]